MEKYDVCVAGGGASGLAAAAKLDAALRACIFEKNRILGRKIMATGGGRCNITNESCSRRSMTLDFFRSLGLETYCDEEGRYYPYSNRAADVVEILEREINKKKRDVYTDHPVESVSCEGDGFVVTAGDVKVKASSLILATGGKAAPQFGTTGDGYAIAKSLGHSVRRLYPVLTGVLCEGFDDAAGVRAKGRVSLYKDGRIIAGEEGEIQFVRGGISGICVMDLSMHIRAEEGEKITDAFRRYEIGLDLAPDIPQERLDGRESSFGILTGKLAEIVGPGRIKDVRIPVKGVRGWKDAQCTGGGIPLCEIDEDTMGSKKKRGLYITGELLDIQERCGGFNLQNAWESGLKAAEHINDEIQDKSDKT